jgi:undecaprenyl-diphosphatase
MACGAFFVGAGAYVTHRGEPAFLLAWEHSLVGHSALLAWRLTWLCYPQTLVPLCAALSIIAWRVPAWRARILFSIVILLLSWRAADLAQHLFMRPRRLDWVVKHETSFSYPSSHAAIVAGFYWLWAWMLARSEFERWVRIGAAAALAALGYAICWSRLALGAHYLTDLLGGVALGTALGAAGWAIFPAAGRRVTLPP